MALQVTARETRVPIFFDSSGRSLFGCYHPPAAGKSRTAALVLCYPWGQEYLRAHRSFLQLARRLAAAGFPVLRFDYFGTGDSAGASDEGEIGHWMADIAAAADEVRGRSATESVCLVGLRLGGALAVQAAVELGTVDSVVLWDPVVDGRSYLDELASMQAQMLRYEYVDPALSTGTGSAPGEVLGFPLHTPLREGLERIDLLGIERTPADRVLLIETEDSPSGRRLQEHLVSLSPDVEHRRVPERKVWTAEPMQGLVPTKLIESVVGWCAEVYP